jgi:TonB family protein
VRQATPAQPKSDFPAPMDFSFGSPKAEPGAPARGKPLLSLGLPRRGVDDSTPFSLDTDAEVGPDWRNALSEWVEEHSYYPQQAAALGQQGTTRVLVTTMPDGRVLSVELERGSGSPWLDLALEGLFRGAKLPPMPKSVGDQPVPFHFTMHYIIVR